MNMRFRTLLSVALAAFLLLAIIYGSAHIIILGSFARLEQADTLNRLKGVQGYLSDYLTSLNKQTADWAAWDDAYAFMVHPNETFIRKNMPDETYIDLRFNVIIFVTPAGRVLYGKSFDLEKKELEPLPDSFTPLLQADSPLVDQQDPERGVSGIIMLPEGPLMVVSRPILTSERKGPIRGALIIGRYLDQAEVKKITQVTNMTLTVEKVDNPKLPADFEAARTFFSRGDSVMASAEDDSVHGYALIRDIYGKPALILRASMPRAIYQQGKSAIRYFMLWAVILCLFGAAIIAIVADKLLATRQAREESEARYRALFEQAREGIGFFDPSNGRLLGANDSFRRLFGLSGVEEKKFSLTDLRSRDSGEKRDTGAGAGTTGVDERRYRRRDGSAVDVEVSTSSVLDGGRQVICLLCHDVTERRRSELKLLRSADTLKQSNEELLSYAFILSHDLRTPLVSLQGFVGELTKGVNTLLRVAGVVTGSREASDEVRESLGFIRLSVEKMERLVLGVGKLSRLASRTLRIEPVDTAMVVDGLISPRRSDKVTFTVSPLPMLESDRGGVEAIFAELFDNAIKYADPQRLCQISVTNQATADEVTFCVTDTGRGIAIDDLVKVFDLFRRSGEQSIPGDGLGLSSVRTMVRRLGGHVRVESILGQGSSFFITLPLQGKL
ncbi:MAG TPA: CHASE4 domain-containing protein [Geobacterales bacterium]|nr:CHASE4 domain-containing protein [Geobacterales bacterium]